MKQLCRYTLCFLLIVVFILLLSLLFFGFEDVTTSLLKVLGQENQEEQVLTLVERIPTFFPIVLLFVLGGLIALVLYKLDLVSYYIERFLYYWKQAFFNLFRDVSRLELLVAIIIPLGASIYFANTIAVSYDEAITYNLFTSKPFFYCMIFYPYPNNHVFHSLLTNITEYIPFISVLFSIRIPAILASLFTWLIAYSFIKKYYSSRVSLLVIGLTSAMYMSIYYSFMSRGYAFMVLAFVVSLYAAYNIIYKGSKNKDWMFLVVAGVLGCYTIPSFLYPFATVNVLILIYNYKNIRQQIIANTIAGISILLLYAPIMLVDGIASLTSNQFVQHVSRMDILYGIFNFYRGMFAEIADVPYLLLWIIVIPFLLTIYQKDKQHLILWIVFMIAPFLLLMLHAVNSFYRTFLYYNIVLPLLMLVPFKNYLEKIPLYAVLVFIVILQIVGVYNFNSKIKEREGFNTFAKEVAETYFKEGNTIVFPCVSSANYEFEAKVKHLEDDIHFLNNVTASADTINDCDYIILEKSRDKTLHKKPSDIIGEQHIYKNTQ